MASGSKKVIYAALAGNLLVTITKFIAASITGSSAMLSEGIHSAVDTGNQGLLLYGLRQSSKPADEEFPFGHGKEIYFWSFIVAILIFAMGSGVSIYEGILHINHPEPISDPSVNYLVLVLALIFEGAAWYFAFKEFSRSKGKWGYLEAVKKGKDPSLFMVLFEDSAAMLGLLVAFLGIAVSQWTGDAFYDGAASVVIGFILAGTAVWLAIETKSLLIGESAEHEVVSDIRKIVQAHASVEYINEVLTLHMGPDFILVTISVDFADDCVVGAIETTIAEMDAQIKAAQPMVKRVFVEAEARPKIA